MPKVPSYFLLYLLFSLFISCYSSVSYSFDKELIWAETDKPGNTKINLYFFWSKKCPHCLEAQPFVSKLAKEKDWLNLHSLELSQHPENVEFYESIATKMQLSRISVPAFMFCGNVFFGYDTDVTTGEALTRNLQSCLDYVKNQYNKEEVPVQAPRPTEDSSLSVPLLGDLDINTYSLPAFTFIIAFLDAFNPCAFFVLLFLLSLLTHTHSRKRMLYIGGTFVFISGFVYFLFMAAWLNMFILFGKMQYVTLISGLVAVTISLINIKDYLKKESA